MDTKTLRTRTLKRSGVLTFEWLLLFLVLAIGVIGGIATMRDSISLKFFHTAGALGALDTGYEVPACTVDVNGTNVTVPAQHNASSKFDVTIQ